MWHVSFPQELQDLRMAMSAMPVEENIQMSAWILQSKGAVIDLQRSPRSYAWPCSVFGFLCDSNRLDAFVQMDISPGYCWPFQASQSQVVIRLPAQVQPTAITVQHPLKESSGLGDISSAPQDFTVSGMDGEKETLLGTFTYDIAEQPIQTFPLQNERPGAFQFIRLAIQSNWGKSGNTCIYRVQVHGKRRKVVKNSMQLLDKMSEKFPQQCLREKTSFRFPNQVLKPRQKETVKVAIEEIFQNIFYIFSKNLTLAAWDETALGQFQNGLYQQIEQLEACVIKKQTLHFWSKDPNRLKLKKYFKEIDCFLKDKQYSLCSWEISRAEMRRCLQLVDKVVRKLNN
ncbi:interferon alpha-13-like isoform X2 [Pezoporus occidentalis]|uniref:interferon alpha-13-like isoform X2 n=1 Tax=Pezoporus occidentalis TaxID=407982 RepID=UPI002F91415D